jgi:hypothetical protein
MVLRRAFVLVAALGVATACTAVLGVEDVPNAPGVDASPAPTGTVAPPPDSGGPAVDAGLDLKTEEKAFATASCTKYKDCAAPDFDYNYKDLDECIAAVLAGENWALALPGVAATAESYRDCASNVTALSCVDFGSSATGAACAFKGTRPTDAKCLSNAQCASGFCGSDNTTCRGCATPPDKGAPCGPGDQCGPGLACVSKTCVLEAKEGQSCSDDQPCAYPLECRSSKCTPRIGTAGAACGGTNGTCDTTKGLLCVSSKCVPFTVSAPGAACGSTDGGTYRYCRRATKCIDGKCADFPKEGEPCDPSEGPICLSPLLCINGKCTGLPASSTCE